MNPTYRRRTILTAGFGGAAAWLLGANYVLPKTASENHLKNTSIKYLPALAFVAATKLEDFFSKKETAVHEAGHALAMMYTPNAELLSVLILNDKKSQSTGHARWIYEDYSKLNEEQLFDYMIVDMAGKAAEIEIYGERHKPKGAGRDIKDAKMLAKLILGEDATRQDVNDLVSEAHNGAKKLMTENKWQLGILSQALYEKKELSRAEVYGVLDIEDFSDDIDFENLEM